MKNIGIVCEGPTDYIILKKIVDKITEEDNYFLQLQPEPDLTGQYGNGWKGVWKWCKDNAPMKRQLMKEIEPSLDMLIIHVDGDVSRKEKATHCWCKSTQCKYKGVYNPIECDVRKETREACPVILPCSEHGSSIEGYMGHLEGLIKVWLDDLSDTCIVVPCDSIEAWIVAAYDKNERAEEIEDPWISIISKKKYYQGIRISGTKKRTRLYEQFADVVCSNWKYVTELCFSAKKFEENINMMAQ